MRLTRCDASAASHCVMPRQLRHAASAASVRISARQPRQCASVCISRVRAHQRRVRARQSTLERQSALGKAKSLKSLKCKEPIYGIGTPLLGVGAEPVSHSQAIPCHSATFITSRGLWCRDGAGSSRCSRDRHYGRLCDSPTPMAWVSAEGLQGGCLPEQQGGHLRMLLQLCRRSAA